MYCINLHCCLRLQRKGTRFYWHDIVLLYDIDMDCTIEHVSLTRLYVQLWHCEDGLDTGYEQCV